MPSPGVRGLALIFSGAVWEASGVLAVPGHPREVGATPRVSISPHGTLVRGEQEVKLMGGNWVVKAQPYFPPLEITRARAKAMADGARAMSYRDPGGAEILPCVRLGSLFEGAMPHNSTAGIDPQWAADLDATVKAFAAEGVYVFLDIHQDGLSTTNGGEGFPWWVAAKMQETAPHESFIVSPEHPLDFSLGDEFERILKDLGIDVPTVKTYPGDKDPWRAYSVGANDGDPRFMNVGNMNIRLNNNDGAWNEGVLALSKQVQNIAPRWYKAYSSREDKPLFFDPFVKFVKHLCQVWAENSNVVAVELLNEPPPGGLPNFAELALTRRLLFDWYGSVLKELSNAKVRTPIAIEDVGGCLPGAGKLMELVAVVPLSGWSEDVLAEWAKKSQLILSFHAYKSRLNPLDLGAMVHEAMKEASSRFGRKVPIWLSEFYTGSSKSSAANLALAAGMGCNAITYWHQADLNFTGTKGWYKYPAVVQALGEPVVNKQINMKSWVEYEKTVRNGTFFGADITGSGGAKEEVLGLVPAETLFI
jgi:hypothetical protein